MTLGFSPDYRDPIRYEERAFEHPEQNDPQVQRWSWRWNAWVTDDGRDDRWGYEGHVGR